MACEYIAKCYRKFPQGSHLVFYRQDDENVVEIIRIFHKAMDVSAVANNLLGDLPELGQLNNKQSAPSAYL